MEPTYFGVIIAVAGLYLLSKPPEWMLSMMLISCAFGGAAAINLPALGGSSISPAHFALGFVVLRTLFSAYGKGGRLLSAVDENLFLVCFAVYTAATAFILPRMFAGRMDVTLLRVNASEWASQPLHFTNQNITTAIYLIGTMITALSASLIGKNKSVAPIIFYTVVILAWIHVAFGATDLVLSFLGKKEILDIFRNGGYDQLSQDVAGFRRISGVFPEPSGYADFGYFLLIFLTELWLRRISPRKTGPAAIALLAMLVISTSSTAYIGLAAYALILGIRFIYVPSGATTSRVVVAGAIGLSGVALVLLLTAINPSLAGKMLTVLESMTFNKHLSESGVQRALWARQGLDAFRISHGLGIGAGSFRSSSLYTAILGSSGVIGVALFGLCILQVFRPLRPSTYRLDIDGVAGLGAAASWAAVVGLIPALFIGASADPGTIFAVFGGLAVGWRTLSLAPADTAERIGVPGRFGTPRRTNWGAMVVGFRRSAGEP